MKSNNGILGFLFIAGFFILVGLFSVDSTPIKRHRRSTSVHSSINYKGQFRKAHYRPAVSINKHAVRNHTRSRYYYKTRGKYKKNNRQMKDKTIYYYDELIKIAKSKKWCISSSCTTCRCFQFREAIKLMLSIDKEKFIDSIYNTKFSKNGSFFFVESVMQLFVVLKEEEKIKILEYWINRKDLKTDILDHLYFYIVKYYLNNKVGQIWISKCIDTAINEKNISLTESIILSLKERSKNYLKLTNLIAELSIQ